jgi:hypothetical protein|tara:strand:- start:323 stop:2116 length:1794 start_codon:yes stop_codon:yes gene_type:complete
LAHFFARTFPRVIKEQQQKYIFQTGTNRLDYYRDGLNTNHQKEEVGMITYARREESEDEARLEEKSSHESSLSLSRFGSEKTREDDDVSESADTSGLDYASLPRVLLKGDKLQCKCGSWKCESFDQPRVSFVISREIEDVGELLNVLNSIDAMDGDEGKDCEVLVNGDGLKSSSSSKDNGEDGINALIAMIRKQGGFTNNLASYRNEPLERIVIVKSESGNNKNDDGVMLERLVSGALAAKVRFVENAGNVREETPMELKTTVLKRLRAVDSSSSSSSGSSSSSTPTSKADVHPRVSFAVQYFKRPNLVQKIATQLAGYAIKYNFAVEVLINDDSATEIQEWHEALKQIPHAIVCAGNVHEIRGYNRLALMSRAQIVAVIQDDDLPPTEPNWLIQAEDNFYEHKKLALIAGLVGQIQGGPDTGRWGKQRGRHVKQIPYYDSKGRPFMFVSWANIGPFVLKRDAFLSSGMFHDSYSCRGDPGIGFDYEYGIRLWRNNREVALQIMQFRYHVGASRTSGTRSSTNMKTRRDNIESRNTKLIHHVHKGFYVNHAPEGANKSPKAKAMSVKQTCKAATLPTLANKRLAKNRKDSKSGFFSG